MWGILVFILFMVLFVCFVFWQLRAIFKKEKNGSVNVPTPKNGNKARMQNNEISNDKKEQDDKYQKLFPNVMIDENDKNVSDADNVLDDMIFMDLMDDD